MSTPSVSDPTAPVRSRVLLRAGRCAAGALALALLLVAGCEEDVNPFIGTNLPYTVWGYINPKADTHAVRVFTIDDQLRLISPEPIDATVSLVRVSDGRRSFWVDSTVQLFNGDYRHIFWLAEPVTPGETYRLEVERSDGVVTRSEAVIVPDPIALELLPPNENVVSSIELPVLFRGDPPALPRVEVTYRTYSTNTAGVTTATLPVVISYTTRPIRRPEGWELLVQLRDDFRIIARSYAEQELPAQFICADSLQLDVHVGDAGWVSPVGVFDENFLVEPGTLSNIENGFGFFGAGYIESITWHPSDLLLVRAGFDDCTGVSN
ncbi:MAG: DUF4249 family protein [Rhodothermales bacterium]